MVKKVPQKFETSDGLEFDSEHEATAHEELIEAKAKYEEAKRYYSRLLWESQKTADGESFDFSLLHDYWHVQHWADWPRLQKVSFYVWHCELDDRDEAVILQKGDRGDTWLKYRISELYYHKENAERELVKCQKQRLLGLRKEISETESRLAGQLLKEER